MAKSNRIYQAVREVLFREWDPIGVNDNPVCQDECDSYAPAVCRMPAAGADKVVGRPVARDAFAIVDTVRPPDTVAGPPSPTTRDASPGCLSLPARR